MSAPLQRKLALLIVVMVICSNRPAASAEDSPTFENDILPLLTQRCGKCHSEKARKGGLNLSTMEAIRRGGESGESSIADSLDDSLLWIMIDDGAMPPEDEPPLTDAEKLLLRKWLELGAPSDSTPTEVVVTQHDVLPFLFARCAVCHGGRRTEADLDVRTVEGLFKGGKSGPAIVAGDSVNSLLVQKIQAKDMPPPREIIRAGVRPFESGEIELLSKWIDQGASQFDIQPSIQTTEPDLMVTDEDRDFWSFQTPEKPEVASLKSNESTAIDSFIAHRHKQRHLTFSPEAERLTLIRRVAFDLTGLPPKWDDVERFSRDESGDWYADLVDHYLASPHYGERWGRYWLDLCGYADSEGKRSADPIRKHAWRYRDYVIAALNQDKPYNQFLIEQLAGDELSDFAGEGDISPDVMSSLVATGFLRMAPDGTGSDIVDTVAERFEVVADEIDILGSAVLGLTLKCAQCHSHKYDPIPQRDYYRLVAVFQGAYDVYDWLKPTSVTGQSKQKNPTRRFLSQVSGDVGAAWSRKVKGIDAQIAEVQRRQDDAEKKFRNEYVEEQLKKADPEMQARARSILSKAEDKRSEEEKKAVSKLSPSTKSLASKHAAFKKIYDSTQKEIKALEAGKPEQPMVRALWDRGEPSPTWVFRGGEFPNPGDLVGPGVLSVLTDGKTPFQPVPQREGSTGRRLAFARWLTDEKHPLTARVLVNRIWYHHFGRGIVESLSNFGRTGTPPTHPELLDWLAVSFMENGWSLKWLHREIMNTRTYRQSSVLRPQNEMHDPDNRWLSRMPLRRLEAESVRDSLLAVAGQLDDRRFGEPDAVTVRADGLVTSDRNEEGWRRTVYVLQRRKELPTILEAFDLPQMNPNCVERPNSTVASQALHLLNNGMVREVADHFATRVQHEAGTDRYGQIKYIYRTTFGRQPTAEEMQLSLETLSELTAHWEKVKTSSADANDKTDQEAADDNSEDTAASPEFKALANYCHVVMNSAEFLFID